jgi:hypothetical protein
MYLQSAVFGLPFSLPPLMGIQVLAAAFIFRQVGGNAVPAGYRFHAGVKMLCFQNLKNSGPVLVAIPEGNPRQAGFVVMRMNFNGLKHAAVLGLS